MLDLGSSKRSQKKFPSLQKKVKPKKTVKLVSQEERPRRENLFTTSTLRPYSARNPIIRSPMPPKPTTEKISLI